MEPSPSSCTRVSLLVRIQNDPTDQQAWMEFVQRYGPKIHAWTRQWRLQESDAEDVTQNVLLKLATKLRTFTYDPALSFRGWLRTLTQNALSDFLSERRRPGQGSGDSQVALVLDSVEAREDLLQRLEEEFDRELLEEAMARVRLRVAPQTWEAFRLTALEGRPGAEAADLIPMQVAQVFVAKRRVQKLLQEEVARLNGPAEG